MTGGGRFFHQDFTETQSFTTFIYNLTGGNNTTTALSNHIFKLDTTYEFVDQHRVYALFSQGFRRGGANMFPLAGVYQESPQILDYAPDKANNYEFGFKGQFDHALRYTADVFYIDWDNPQIGISTPNYWPVAVNGKKARSQGAELEIHTPVFTPQLDAAIGYTYTDAKLTKSFCLPTGNGTGLPAPAGFDSCGIEGVSGERMPGTAEQDFSGTLTYNQLLSAGKSAVYLVNVNYRGQILNSLGTATNFYRQVYLGGYTVTNISATWPLSTAVTLGLYCTNLLDKRAELAAPERPVAFLGNLANIYTINDPRQVGLRVGYKW
jgi:outer membrane receptor protein involved in Fe transport